MIVYEKLRTNPLSDISDYARKSGIQECRDLSDLLAAFNERSYRRGGPDDGNAGRRRASDAEALAIMRGRNPCLEWLKSIDLVVRSRARLFAIADCSGINYSDPSERAIARLFFLEEGSKPIAPDRSLVDVTVAALLDDWCLSDGLVDRDAFHSFVADALHGRREFPKTVVEAAVEGALDARGW